MPQIKNKQSGLTMTVNDEATKKPGAYDSNYWDPVDFSAPTTPVENKPVVNYGEDGSRTLTAADKYWQDNPVSSKDEFATQQLNTKADFAKRQQDAIDSINNMYVSILSRANQTGQDKLGSANVINALSGQRGSASGAANVDKVNQSNDEIYKGVLAEKQNKINAIVDKTYKDQTEELKYQNDLRRKDLNSYLSYMGTKETENLTKSKEMRAELISGNIGIEDIEPDTLQRMAESAGYTVDQFKVLYESERKANEQTFLKNEEKRLLEIEKLKQETDPVAKTLLSKGYIPITDPKQLEGLKESEIERVGEKIYKKPMSELEEYEAKKKIDAKYKGGNSGSGSGDNGDETPEEKAFKKTLQSEKDKLISKGSWAESYDRMASRYPEYAVQLTPEEKAEYGAQEGDETLLDIVLNKSKYASNTGNKTTPSNDLNYEDF